MNNNLKIIKKKFELNQRQILNIFATKYTFTYNQDGTGGGNKLAQRMFDWDNFRPSKTKIKQVISDYSLFEELENLYGNEFSLKEFLGFVGGKASEEHVRANFDRIPRDKYEEDIDIDIFFEGTMCLAKPSCDVDSGGYPSSDCKGCYTCNFLPDEDIEGIELFIFENKFANKELLNGILGYKIGTKFHVALNKNGKVVAYFPFESFNNVSLVYKNSLMDEFKAKGKVIRVKIEWCSLSNSRAKILAFCVGEKVGDTRHFKYKSKTLEDLKALAASGNNAGEELLK